MWQNDICAVLAADRKSLQERGDTSYLDTLTFLQESIEKARTVSCGREECILLDAGEKPPLFLPYEDGGPKRIRRLPEPLYLFEFSTCDTHRAYLVVNRNDRLDVYVFRYRQEWQRWIWPFIGMQYGPSETDFIPVPVYDAARIRALPAHAQTGMIQEHARDAHLLPYVLAALQDDDTQRKQHPSRRKPTIAPSSWARRARTQHKKRGSLQNGAQRS